MSDKTRKRNWLKRSLLLACFSVVSSTIVVPSGCNRAHYRNRADQEVTNVINEKIADACAPAIPSIQMDRASRMFDPFNPDRPPMPEDDSTAHQYMKVLNGKKGYPLWDVNGKTNTAENPIWWQYLPLDERGVLVLDADAAVRTAVLHSTVYQLRDYRLSIREHIQTFSSVFPVTNIDANIQPRNHAYNQKRRNW